MHQKLLKDGNCDQKYLRCPELRGNNFEVLRSAIILGKVDLECVETVNAKPTGNNLGFTTTSNTINFWVYG